MKHLLKIIILLFASSQALFPITVSFRFFDDGLNTRIVFEGNNRFEYRLQMSEDRIDIIIPERVDLSPRDINLRNSLLVARLQLEYQGNSSIIHTYFRESYEVRKHFTLNQPFRVVFDLERRGGFPVRTEPPPPSQVERETTPPQTESAGQQEEKSVPITPVSSRRKPIDIICLDPGHGGSDLGAVGKSGVMEKNLTLVLSRKLKRLLETRLGVRVIMTREKDDEISLNARASMANNQQAQLFVSIHVNSSYRRAAFGSETFFVSLNATDQESLELAQKENLSNDNLGEEIQNDDLKLILWNMAQTEYIKDSSRLAEYIQSELNELLGTRNRGVKQAPFRVLMRSAMPSVLIEVAFISNRSEEKRLTEESFQDRIAQAVFNGISRFISEYNQSLK